jgi:stage II sporulation protein D
MEALKAQAVCARSFAWRQMRSNSYKAYGADVDDTTAFQVYHMAGEDARTRRAVDRTAGKKVYSGDHVITTYYYSTSWGCSASEQEAWGTAKGSNYPVRFQTDSEDVGPGLSSEMRFYDFITGSKETYDSGYDWYRWSVTLSADTLGAKLGIGTVRKITVISRGKSGLICKLRVRGSLGRITLEGQEEIRQKLYPSETEITKKKSGETAVLSMLPSAAFTVLDGSEKGTRTFTLIGGGLGHGVGMSQNGAGEMARQGKNYRQILKHYYSHCKVQ